jgi:hypothetical protein
MDMTDEEYRALVDRGLARMRLTPAQCLAGLTAQERLAGLTVLERVDGLTVQERLEGCPSKRSCCASLMMNCG